MEVYKIKSHLDCQADSLTIESKNFDFDGLVALDHIRYRSDATFSTQLTTKRSIDCSISQSIIQSINPTVFVCISVTCHILSS